MSDNEPSISVDDEVFGPVAGRYLMWHQSVEVMTDQPELAAAALERAGSRFMDVAEDGRELSPDDPNWTSPWPMYTPNSVSDVRTDGRGPSLGVDCKGEVPDAMRQTFIAILVEELRRAGVREARITVPAS